MQQQKFEWKSFIEFHLKPLRKVDFEHRFLKNYAT